MQGNLYLLLPLALPLAAGFALYYLRVSEKLRARLTTLLLFVCALCGAGALLMPGTELTVCRLTRELTVAFRVDAVSRVYLLLLSVVWPMVGLYATGYLHNDQQAKRFYLFYMLTWTALYALAMARNLVTLYMFYEAMTLLSLPLVLHDRTREAIAAAVKYLIYSVIGASCALLGIFYIASKGLGLEFVPGGFLQGAADGSPALTTALLFVTLLGFGVKAGLFPMHAWLPTAHPVAPAPASAVLSGVITKMGVLGMLRVIYFAAGASALRGTWAQYALMALSLLTLVMGSSLALKEKQFKKRLAYSSVSQLSYVIFGLSTLTEWGFAGAMLHILCHSLIKDTLFMCAGAVIHQTGEKNVDALRGVGKRMPVTMGCFFAASLALVGIPPFCGFVSKWYIARGALSLAGAVSWIGPAALLLSAILTAGYLLTVGIRAFFPGEEALSTAVESAREAGWRMTVPMLTLAALSLALGLFPGALINAFTGLAALIL